MDLSLLQMFRQQLAAWIEVRFESKRLPFKRLEQCPRILTDLGVLAPDLVLWINRDSQLAGSMLLLPEAVDDQVLAEGASLARALGLGHFTTWAAHEVSIWSLATGPAVQLYSFALPPASRVTPDDFQKTLDLLLDQLKIVTVTSAPDKTDYTLHYFANLCLRNLQDLVPGLTISARTAAGQSAADDWLALAPLEKAWMSLWRILFLLWQGRLPPGLQPERFEAAFHYALEDLTSGRKSRLVIQDSEPPLPESDAVRLHHLAGRLRQLGWPHGDQQAVELLDLLLVEAGRQFGIEPPCIPWSVDEVTHWVACQPPAIAHPCCLVGPRAYLAGWELRASRQQGARGNHAETLQELEAGQRTQGVIAALHKTQPLHRKVRETRQILLRQVWPSRRFEIPRNAPEWLWDALHLAGLSSGALSLTLPEDWSQAPGVPTLWATLAERYQLAGLYAHATGEQSLLFVPATAPLSKVRVYRRAQTIEASGVHFCGQPPGSTQLWLKAGDELLALLGSHSLSAVAPGTDWSEDLTWGLHLFLRTRLGRYLWDLCGDQPALPEFGEAKNAVAACGLPLPNELVLYDLASLGSARTLEPPAPDLLEREFGNFFGPVPDLPDRTSQAPQRAAKVRRSSSATVDKILSQVFVDGIPRFPDHYLMNVYRPALASYDICGPLEVAEEFFERITLRTVGQPHELVVSGRLVAEALILASHSGRTAVSLPEDEQLLNEVVVRYRADLRSLWDRLVRECRRCEPNRQAAVKLARRLWQEQGLPPESVLQNG